MHICIIKTTFHVYILFSLLNITRVCQKVCYTLLIVFIICEAYLDISVYLLTSHISSSLFSYFYFTQIHVQGTTLYHHTSTSLLFSITNCTTTRAAIFIFPYHPTATTVPSTFHNVSGLHHFFHTKVNWKIKFYRFLKFRQDSSFFQSFHQDSLFLSYKRDSRFCNFFEVRGYGFCTAIDGNDGGEFDFISKIRFKTIWIFL